MSESQTSTQCSRGVEGTNGQWTIFTALSPFTSLPSCAHTKRQESCLAQFGRATSTCLAAGWEALLQPSNPVVLQLWEAQCQDLLLNAGEVVREGVKWRVPKDAEIALFRNSEGEGAYVTFDL